MAKIKKRIMGLALVGIMSIGSIASIVPNLNKAKVVSAAPNEVINHYIKSREGSIALNKVRQIINSIKNNYAGIKNQPTWEGYIKEARALVNKIPSRYKEDIVNITTMVDDLDHIVKYIAKMNHVEKSYEENFKGIKNAAQWESYLQEAMEERYAIQWYWIDIRELESKVEGVDDRFDIINAKVGKIIEDHFIAFYEVVGIFNEATYENSLQKAQLALSEVNKLGTHESTAELKDAIMDFIINFR